MRLRPYFVPPRRRVTAQEILAILSKEKITQFGGTVTIAAPLPLPAGEGQGEGEKQRPPAPNDQDHA